MGEISLIFLCKSGGVKPFENMEKSEKIRKYVNKNSMKIIGFRGRGAFAENRRGHSVEPSYIIIANENRYMSQ